MNTHTSVSEGVPAATRKRHGSSDKKIHAPTFTMQRSPSGLMAGHYKDKE